MLGYLQMHHSGGEVRLRAECAPRVVPAVREHDVRRRAKGVAAVLHRHPADARDDPKLLRGGFSWAQIIVLLSSFCSFCSGLYGFLSVYFTFIIFVVFINFVSISIIFFVC